MLLAGEKCVGLRVGVEDGVGEFCQPEVVVEPGTGIEEDVFGPGRGRQLGVQDG